MVPYEMSLKLHGEMTIYRATELKDTLWQALQQATDALVTDLSEITEIDIAGIQILMLIQQTAPRMHKTVQWLHPSPVVMNALQALNLNAFFGKALLSDDRADKEGAGHGI